MKNQIQLTDIEACVLISMIHERIKQLTDADDVSHIDILKKIELKLLEIEN